MAATVQTAADAASADTTEVAARVAQGVTDAAEHVAVMVAAFDLAVERETAAAAEALHNVIAAAQVARAYTSPSSPTSCSPTSSPAACKEAPSGLTPCTPASSTRLGERGSRAPAALAGPADPPPDERPRRGAATSVHLTASADSDHLTGRYFANSKPKRTARASHGPATAARLWQVSVDLVGLPVVQPNSEIGPPAPAIAP
jgi:hypothetical protein